MLKIGHRGAAGYEPENTLRSFRKALELKVDMIEFDVQVCKSGEVVVFHDETLDRITRGRGRISELTLQDLKKYNFGKGERIPTLRETLDLINQRALINIELKAKNTAGPVAEMLEEYIGNGWPPKIFLISSFNRKEFARFAKINPGVRLGILVKKNPLDALARAAFYKAYSVHIHHRFLWRWLVKTIQSSGFKVFAFWLPNRKWEERAKEIGVDGIFSDYPDRI
jgi:glycerophosphoryl diester phosphodiesterase